MSIRDESKKHCWKREVTSWKRLWMTQGEKRLKEAEFYFPRVSPIAHVGNFSTGIMGAWTRRENEKQFFLGTLESEEIRGTQPVHTLIIGGTGSGKTRRWIAPAATYWAGPTLITSTKSELANIIHNAERDTISSGARKLLWSPMSDLTIPGWERVYWDPVVEVTDTDSAVNVSSDLMSLYGLSASSSDKFWEHQGSLLLEPILLAAHLLDHDAAWVFQKLTRSMGPNQFWDFALIR